MIRKVGTSQIRLISHIPEYRIEKVKSVLNIPRGYLLTQFIIEQTRARVCYNKAHNICL